MMRRLTSDERGAALIVALGVTFVVLLLSTVVVSQAIHNTQQSGYDRRRLTSVNAAEAGLNFFYHHLENTQLTSLTNSAVTKTLGTAPNTASFTVTPTFYSVTTSPTAADILTPPFTVATPPRSVHLLSVGTSSGGAQRSMESFIQLTPVYGGLGGALIANSTTSFSNNFTLNGNNGNDADVYVLTGDFSVPSGLQTVKGSILVPAGKADILTNLHLYGDVWANQSVTINHPTAQIDGHAKSTTGSVAVTAGTVASNAYYCTGSAPSNVAGSKIQTCSLGAPPTQAFPQIKYLASAWDSLGYKEYVFSGATACTDARTWLEGSGATQWNGGAIVPAPYTGAVVRITQSCTFDVSNNSTIALNKNLGIATVGGINLANRSTWNGVTSTKDLFFLSLWPDSGSPSCPAQNVSIQNMTNFNSLVQTGVYSACGVTMNNNNSAFSGQVIGSTLSIGNNFNMTFRPIVIPGSSISSFREDIAYIREV